MIAIVIMAFLFILYCLFFSAALSTRWSSGARASSCFQPVVPDEWRMARATGTCMERDPGCVRCQGWEIGPCSMASYASWRDWTESGAGIGPIGSSGWVRVWWHVPNSGNMIMGGLEPTTLPLLGVEFSNRCAFIYFYRKERLLRVSRFLLLCLPIPPSLFHLHWAKRVHQLSLPSWNWSRPKSMSHSVFPCIGSVPVLAYLLRFYRMPVNHEARSTPVCLFWQDSGRATGWKPACRDKSDYVHKWCRCQ